MTPFKKRKIRSRKQKFKKNRRSPAWKKRKKETAKLVRDGKRDYYNRFVTLAKKTNDAGLYYRAVAQLKEAEAPRPFSAADLFPGVKHQEVAEKQQTSSQR